jgi:hypothetical protein
MVKQGWALLKESLRTTAVTVGLIVLAFICLMVTAGFFNASRMSAFLIYLANIFGGCVAARFGRLFQHRRQRRRPVDWIAFYARWVRPELSNA